MPLTFIFFKPFLRSTHLPNLGRESRTFGFWMLAILIRLWIIEHYFYIIPVKKIRSGFSRELGSGSLLKKLCFLGIISFKGGNKNE